MYSPHDVTLITVTIAPNGVEERNVTHLHGVFLDSHAGGAIYKNGIQSDDNATLFIPEQTVKATDPLTGIEKQYLAPDLFNNCPDKSSAWTIFPGGKQSSQDCYFVKGLLDASERSEYAALRMRTYEVYRVSNCVYRDFGSPRMHHWQVGGK